MWYIDTMEYYAAVKGTSDGHKLPHGGNSKMLFSPPPQKRQSQEATYCIIPLT